MRPPTPLLALASLLTPAYGCGSPAAVERPLALFEGSTMGTYYRVQVPDEDRAAASGDGLSQERRKALQAAIETELDNVNARMSTWWEDSELSRFNRHRDDSPFALSSATFEVLQAALEVSERTGGAFDVTVGPLVDAWGFGAEDTPPPTAEAIAELRARVGYEKLTLDASARTAAKSRPDLRCDLSGIAKGYAVDRVAEKLTSLGVSAAWVEVGGEVRAVGSRAPGKPWRLGIERPQLAPGAIQRIVPMTGMAVATSGDYRNYREIGGERFSHLIDPRTGWPIRHRLASVSVFHPRCMIADALATALMVLGEDEGYELAEREGLPVFFLVRSADAGGGFVERGTPAFWELAGRAGAAD